MMQQRWPDEARVSNSGARLAHHSLNVGALSSVQLYNLRNCPNGWGGGGSFSLLQYIDAVIQEKIPLTQYFSLFVGHPRYTKKKWLWILWFAVLTIRVSIERVKRFSKEHSPQCQTLMIILVLIICLFIFIINLNLYIYIYKYVYLWKRTYSNWFIWRDDHLSKTILSFPFYLAFYLVCTE